MVDDIIDNESDNGNKYHLKYKKVTVFLGVNEPHGENTLVHNETIPPDSWKFHITSIFIRRALKWNSFDPDIHCIGSYIIWKMVDTKKYNLSKELLPISNVNNANDISGAKEVTDGLGRKRSRNEICTKKARRKRQRDRGQSYTPQDRKGEKSQGRKQEQWKKVVLLAKRNALQY